MPTPSRSIATRLEVIAAVLVVFTLLAGALSPSALASPGTSNSKHITVMETTFPLKHAAIADDWLPGYTGPPRAKVAFPAGYNPNRKYPLLVLLAGVTSDYSFWAAPRLGDIARTAAGLDAIVVMPEGASGWYTDWWNGGARGNPSWETYILDDVIPQVMKRYPIRPERRWHALAGISMGGLGTAYLGGRLPGFFGSIAVMSGLADLHLAPAQGSLLSFISANAAKAPYDPLAVYGPENGPYSRGHDPMKLVSNLRHTRIFMTTGNGEALTPDDTFLDQIAEGLIIRTAMDNYARALRDAGIDITYRTHSGAHTFTNFRRELRAAIAWGLFGPVAERPAKWVNSTVARSGSLWGLRYRFTSAPTRVTRFSRKGDVLKISSAGTSVRLTTPAGCSIRTPTPATVRLSRAACRAG
ncbi:alpha/beta hydrolase [Actinomadura sp. GTD37]|uniref:alpha/beta hydrolase n=1 Tax=Actinomadura sp. GTD37 TaxID=1778030 RepID=UPI0035C0D09B